MNIAIFYHCLFVSGETHEILPGAIHIAHGQMETLQTSGLLDAASEMVVGVNGGSESEVFAREILPTKSRVVYHGLDSRAENLTIVELEKWLPDHPGWMVLYFHAKGATHAVGSSYGGSVSNPWREAMMKYCVTNWRDCVAAMEGGIESAGCHFMRNLCDGTQNIWAGNFFWATSDFLRTLPSIYKRDRITMSGIAALESRYEAEVWIGNGPRCPTVKEFLPHGGEGCP